MPTAAFRRRTHRLAGLPPSPLPDAPSPMLCTLAAEPYDDPAWVFEPKFDGLRLRMPRFEGLRTDKAPKECRRERPRPPEPARRRRP